MEFYFLEDNFLFSIAITVMVLIAIMEGVMSIIGLSIAQTIDNLLPDFDIAPDVNPGFDSSTDIDHASPGGLTGLIGWLKIGKIPVLISLIVLLLSFGLIGFALQTVLITVLGISISSMLLAPVVFLLCLPILRVGNDVMGNFLFKDETEAVASRSFIGKTAVITLGTAKKDEPAEAKFKDQFGTTHYVMVEPIDGNSFNQGESVLIIEEGARGFHVIKPDNPNLI